MKRKILALLLVVGLILSGFSTYVIAEDIPENDIDDTTETTPTKTEVGEPEETDNEEKEVVPDTSGDSATTPDDTTSDEIPETDDPATTDDEDAIADAVTPKSAPRAAGVKITLHFSSVDGELMDPVVIDDIEPGTTCRQAIPTEKYIDGWYSIFFRKEGYRDCSSRTFKPITAYENDDELWDDLIDEDEPLYEDLDAYVGMLKIIDTIELTATPPTCGVDTMIDGPDWQDQTNKPEYTVPSGVHYKKDDTGVSSCWTEIDNFNVPFVGTFEGGETYQALYLLVADYGYCYYYLDQEYSDKVTVNNGTFVETILMWQRDYECLAVVATVEAEHDWDEGTITKEPSATEEGEMTYKCKNFDTCGGTKTEPIPKLEAYTLTIHFSSVDGDDLVSPIVINNIESGTEIGDAVRNGIGKVWAVDWFTKDGYSDSYTRTPKPIRTYTSWDAMYGAEIRPEVKINEDMDLYVCMIKEIDDVEITVTPPLCGEETTIEGYDWQTQTNNPKFTARSGTHYKIGTFYGIESNWIMMDDEDEPYVGEFKGGETYKGRYYLEADFGYCFKWDKSSWKYTGTAKVNGGTFVKVLWSWAYLAVEATVEANHDWGEWTVIQEPTFEEEGEEQRDCKSDTCDEYETRPISKIVYENTSGDGSTWEKGSGKNLDFTFKRSYDDSVTFSQFRGIQIDGKDVDPSNYTAKEGSVIISLKPAYLETLSVGKHTITAIFRDGNNPSATFTITAKGASPDTSDQTNMALWLSILFVAAYALFMDVYYREKLMHE